MKPQHDANEQTGLDMARARVKASISVENVRDFLHREYSHIYSSDVVELNT